MLQGTKILTTAGAFLACFLLVSQLPAAITAQQRDQAKAIQAKLASAARLIRTKLPEAEKLALEAQAAYAQLAASGQGADFDRALRPITSRLNILRRSLKRRGVELPDVPKPDDKPAAGAVSFTKQIAPILTARCRNCHINSMRGKFSMQTFANLMNGVDGAAVVTPRRGKDSRIIEVLRDGDMPKGGNRLPREQVALISAWIDQGARFDGDSPTAAIAAAAPAGTQKGPRLQVVKATGKEGSKFSRDIAPILVARCINCHGGQRPAERLSMTTFEAMLRGSRNNVIITPGKPAESLIIQKLKGTADGAQMPQRQPPLSTEEIAKFEKWIAEGAKFDGPDPGMQTSMVARIYAVTQMSHEELAAERVEMANNNWRLANPDDAPAKVETKSFLLMGNVGEDELNLVGKVAEEQQARIRAMLKAPPSDNFIKGRVTLYVFRRRFDYSEYAQMVEKREIPSSWRGHWRYNIVDAYACIYPPQSEDDDGSLECLVAEQLAGAYLQTLGEMPGWFAQGAAWEIASRIDSKDVRTIKRNDKIQAALAQMSAADDFLTGKTSADTAAVLNYSFVKFLMSSSTRYRALLAQVQKGTEFDKAFKQVYGDREKVALAWARAASKKKR